MNPRDRQQLEQGRVFRNGLEIGSKEDPRRRGCKGFVGRAEGGEPALVQLETQYRFVDLHPGHSQDLEAREQALIGRNEPDEQIELVRKTRLDLAEMEQGERAEQGDL